MRYLGIINIVLAAGLVGLAVWLYGQEHDTRQMERQIRKLEHARKLEEEVSRRLEVEWHRLLRPDRLEALARQWLKLEVPDPMVVMRAREALRKLPLRPADAPEVAEEETQLKDDAPDAAGLKALAAQAARAEPAERSESAGPAEQAPAASRARREDAAPGRGDDPLGALIRATEGVQ